MTAIDTSIDQLAAFQQVGASVAKSFLKQGFETFGDAFSWWQNLDADLAEQESRDIGRSEFSMDIQWLVAQFGPNTSIEKEALAQIKPTKSKPKAIEADISDTQIVTKTKKRRRQRRRKA
jgi:hypothetical protein